MYQIKKSNRKGKKYMAVFNDGRPTVHFGSLRPDGTPYEQFQDTTPLKLYSDFDHKNKKRKDRYYARFGREAKRFSSKYFSHKYLW